MKAKLIKETFGGVSFYTLFTDSLLIPYAKNGNGHGYMKLSLKNCETIERGYNLDELSKSYAIRDDISDEFDYVDSIMKHFKAGLQKAFEIKSDKNFSEEDVKRAMDVTLNYETKRDAESYQEKIDFLKSLQQTEWDVEIDVLMTEREGGVVIETPKLDADGCLILKRIL